MKREFSNQYGDLEQRHWWFRARRVILRGLLQRHVPWRAGTSVLEIGVGPGENLYTLYPENADIVGVEPDPDNALKAGRRGPVPVFCGTVEHLPPEVSGRTFDVICLFDVLEHIEDDVHALELLRGLLKPGGLLIMSVPAYRWMWGLQDVVNLHYRRYTLGGLLRKIRKCPLQVVRGTYFNTLLFPVIASFRLMARFPRKRTGAGSDFDYTAGIVDKLFYSLFRAEWPLLKYIDFPFGVSCFVVAQGDPGTGEPGPLAVNPERTAKPT